ncbi:MAG: hypothetical protein HY746_09075 [Elusimicrobia bacterium]|nr:hypothetical protein [Elusimicrobiota bacterium]
MKQEKNFLKKQEEQQPKTAIPGQTVAQPESLKIPIIVFWSAIALSIALSWGLAEILDKPEYLIERWVMAGLGLFLILFLIKLK